MSTDVFFKRINTFADFKNLIKGAIPEVTFWGGRSVTLYARGQKFQVPLDELSKQVIQMASRMLAVNGSECTYANEVAKKIQTLWNRCDQIIQKKNGITRFFFRNQKAPDFSFLNRICKIRSLTQNNFSSRSSQSVTASSINGTDLWIGSAVATGNVNGDAFQDTIIGAVNVTSGNFSVYVVFSDGSPSDINDLNTITYPKGVIFNGKLNLQFLNEFELSHINFPLINIASGDINGDGKDDIVIGINRFGINYDDYIPTAYVVFGSEQLGNIDNLQEIEPPAGILLNSNITFQDLSIAPWIAVGDINGDDKADIAIGPVNSNGDDNPLFYNAYVIFGSEIPTCINNFSNITSANGIFIRLSAQLGEVFWYFTPLSLAFGDVNGDNITDLAIAGSWGSDSGRTSSTQYVVFGNSHIESIQNIMTLSPPFGFNMTSVCEEGSIGPGGVGDVNGDKYADLIIQCLDFLQIVFGNSNPQSFNGTITSSDMGTRIYYNAHYLGPKLVSGDVNGDGIDDVIFDVNLGTNIYTIFGSANISNINVQSMTSNIGVVFNSTTCFLPNAYSFISLGTGDINNDGKGDIVIGSSFPGVSNLLAQQGYVYEVLGKANLTSIPNYNNLTSNQGIMITGSVTTNGPRACNNNCSYICPQPPITYPPTTTLSTTVAPPITYPTTTTLSTTMIPSTSTPVPNIHKLGTLPLALLISLTSGGSLILFAVISIYLYKRYQKKYRVDDEEAGESIPLLRKSSVIIPINEDFQLAEKQKETEAPNAASKLENLFASERSYKKAAEKQHKESIYALPELYYKIAQTYEEIGDDLNSQTYYERSIDGGFTLAITALERLSRSKNRSVHSDFHTLFVCNEWANKAYAAEQNGNYALARTHLQKAEENDPYHRPIFHLASAYGCREVLVQLADESKDISSLLRAPNSQGRSAIALAYIQKNHYTIRTINEILQYCDRQDRNEIHFQNLLSKLKKSSPQDFESSHSGELLLLEAKDLYDRIFNISEDNVIPQVSEAIKKCLSELPDLFTMTKMIRAISRLLQKCKIPSDFLAEKGVRNQYALEESCKEMRTISNKLQEFIETIPNCPDPIVQGFQEIIQYYEKFLQGIDKCSSLENQLAAFSSPVIFHGLGLRHRILTRESREYLMEESRDNEYGVHIVREYQGVHYKKNPHAPGIEYMVNSLAQVVVGRGTPPTELLKIQDRNESHIYQASKTVVGINLEHLLLAHPELVEKIDAKNFSEMIALSLLTDPQDGKPDNYMVKMILNPQGEVKNLKIISIDNDIAFADPVVKQHYGEDKDQHYVNVKNVLYFLPQMMKPIDADFREKFLSTSAEVMVICWLELLAKKNEEYEQLVIKGVLSQEELEALQLPILFVPGFIDTLKNKIQVMQKALTDHPNLTHLELFKVVEPILQKYYEEIQKETPDPVKATRRLYEKGQPSIEKLLDMKTYIDSRHQLMSVLAYNQAKFTDFETKRSQNLQVEMEKFITKINLPELDEKGQRSIMGYIQKLFLIENLKLTNDSLLTLVSLQELINKFPHLKTLSLENCHLLNEEDLLCTLSKRPNLVLRLGSCKNLSNAQSWRKIANNCSNFTIVIKNFELNISNCAPLDLLRMYRTAKMNIPQLYDFLLQLNALNL